MKTNRIFKRGAWLYTLKKELSEEEFIAEAGVEKLNRFRDYPFVSIVLDRKPPLVIGHNSGRIIAFVMGENNHKLWQTMEWK